MILEANNVAHISYLPTALGKMAADIFRLSEKDMPTMLALSLKFARIFFSRCRTVPNLECRVPYTGTCPIHQHYEPERAA